MPCRPPRLAKSSSTDWPTRLVIGPLQGYRRPDLENRNATAAVIGAGDFIGAAIAKKFASEGFTVFAGRRHGDKLAPLVGEIEAAGGRIVGRSLDARKEEEITAFLQDADATAPLEVCVFNIGANVNFPLLETTERVFRKFGNGLLCRLPDRPRGSAPDAAARPRQYLLYRRHRRNAWRDRLCRLCQRQIRLARSGAECARELGPKNIHVA